MIRLMPRNPVIETLCNAAGLTAFPEGLGFRCRMQTKYLPRFPHNIHSRLFWKVVDTMKTAVCDCGKQFQNAIALKQHRFSSSKHEQFPCECGATFITMAARDQHRRDSRLHAGPRPVSAATAVAFPDSHEAVNSKSATQSPAVQSSKAKQPDASGGGPSTATTTLSGAQTTGSVPNSKAHLHTVKVIFIYTCLNRC